MKLYVLPLGLFDVEETVLDSGAEPGKRVCVPVWSLLICHEKGNVIFDLGCAADDPSLRAASDETMEGQLAKLNLTCRDIDKVVLSHLHGDHFGALPLFTHADVYVGDEEWSQALVRAFDRADGRRGALWERFMLPVKQYHRVSRGGDFELLPGVRVLSLPGHTENLLGLEVTVGGRHLVFPSDSVYTPVNFERFPGACPREEDYVHSRERIKAIEQAGGEIIYSHWKEQYDRLPKAPLPLAED